MSSRSEPAYVAFEGDRCVAAGDLGEVARAVKALLDRRKDSSVLIFDSTTGGPVDIDFRGSIPDVLARLADPSGVPATSGGDAAPAQRGPGRPKLGVVAREVTLLPRHWEWLAQQRGSASVALRRLVDEARRNGEDGGRRRDGQEAAYRFLSAIAGNQPHYEAAIRALFRGEPAVFEKVIAGWPADVRQHASRLAERAFDRTSSSAAPVDPADTSG